MSGMMFINLTHHRLLILVALVIYTSGDIGATSTTSLVQKNTPNVDVTTIAANFSTEYHGQVKQGIDILYEYSYKHIANKSTAVRVTVTGNEADRNFPIVFVVRQQRSILSWQIPLWLEYTYDYYRVSRTLCPEENRDRNLTEQKLIYVDVSSMSTTETNFTLYALPLDSFQLEDTEVKSFAVTPSEPSYYRFTFPDGVDSTLVLARSDSSHCAILSVQDTQCPVFEMNNNVEFSGMSQTMTTRAAITVKRENFKGDSFFIVLVLKANDEDCSDMESHLPRLKNVTIFTKHNMSAREYGTAIIVTVGVFLCFYAAIAPFALISPYRKCDKKLGKPDKSPAGTLMVHEEMPFGTWPARSEPTDELSEEPGLRLLESGEVSGNKTGSSSVDNDTDSRHIDSALDTQDIEVVRTQTFLYVSDLAKNLTKRYKLYHWNLVTIAIFYGLPVVQLVITYQQMLNRTGEEDYCYYNFECSRPLGVISNFNNVFSNVGFIFLGILFLILVLIRQSIHKKAVKRHDDLEKIFGIPQHFGLLYAMGWALCMEGVMSACYHVCPTSSNFQFDTSFMYIIACLDILKIYQTRHPDITAKAHVSYLAIAFLIFITVIGVLYGTKYFWIVFTVLHLICTFLLSIQIYFMGQWKIDCGIFKRAFLLMRKNCCSRPMYPSRMAMVLVLNIVNWALALYGVLTRPNDFASFLLGILIVNLMTYVTYYIIMKLISKEKIKILPIMCIFLSSVLMGFALWFFVAQLTEWSLYPAGSREGNRPCILLNFYDAHDVWHFLAAMGVFFSCMMLLTLDDDLIFTRRDRIPVF